MERNNFKKTAREIMTDKKSMIRQKDESMRKLKNPMILDMVRDYLKEHEFDGLFSCDGLCSCLTDDLAPCGSISEDCAAGYKHNYPDHYCPCGEGCAWHIEEFPAKKTDKCRCETEKWVTVDGNGSRKRSDFVIDDDPSTCSNGCCEKLKCKLCGRNSWSSKPIEKLLNRSSKNTTS